METANKRHGKKTDKETQSPVLKVFKEMIQREKIDPEKANLLKAKQENRKRRQHSGSRSKSERVNRSGDSSSSEKNRRSVQYKVAVHEQRLKDYNQRSQNTPFQGDKKDSWWFWGDNTNNNNNNNNTQKKQSEDTCSCVSCALKKIISSEYTCIACLGVVFLLSVLVAFLFLFRTAPIVARNIYHKPTAKKPREIGSDVLKRKIEMIQRGCKGDSYDDRRVWDDSMNSRHLSSLTGLHGNDFDEGSYRELNSLEDSGIRTDSELSSILDTEKLNDGMGSERLRNFYKKLIQTDAQIRNLKKNVNDYTQTNYKDAKFNYPDRYKRSLKLIPKSFLRNDVKKDVNDLPVVPPSNVADLSKFSLFYPPYTAVKASNKNNKKYKRYVNGTDEPTGFVIEKKQIVVQYKPHDNLRKVPKCSHAPKDSKSHEKQMKHPFYKNTQRLDELLDQFLDKSLPEMMVDPFGVDVLFKNKDVNKEGVYKTHKTNVKIENEVATKKPMTVMKNKEENNRLFDKNKGGDNRMFELKNKEDDHRLFELKNKEDNHRLFEQKNKEDDHRLFEIKNKDEDNRLFELNRIGSNKIGELDREFFNMVSSKRKGKISTSSSVTPSYDVILSVSTIVNPGQRKVSKPMNILGRTPSLLDRVPHIRKLMQFEEEDEEGLGYEDLKEVLADDTEAHDETDKVQDRNKRMDDYKADDFKNPSNSFKYNPPGVHNPNWKGPMPLYPDELSSMIKQAAIQNIQNFNKIQMHGNTKEMSSEADGAENDLNDMEYIENYSDNKFNKLARMAQAYSDYGVLEGKKDSARNEKVMDGRNVERRIKLSANKGKSFKNVLFDRFKKRKVSEGIRFEIRPTTPTREDSPVELMKTLEKHVKVTNNKYFQPFHSTSLPINTDYALFSALQKQQGSQTNDMSTKKVEQNEYPDSGVVFTFAKSGRRSLKSVIEDTGVNDKDIIKTQEDQEDKHTLKGISGLNVKKSDHSKNFTANLVQNVIQGNDDYNDTLSNSTKISVNNITDTNQIYNVINETDSTANSTLGDSDKVLQDNSIITTIFNLNAPRNNSEMDISEFFMMISNWFSLMAGLDTSNKSNESNTNIINLTSKPITMNTFSKCNDTINIEFPTYDSDMIENIGHRSRVLMSVEDKNLKSTDSADIMSKVNTNSINNNDFDTTSMSTVFVEDKTAADNTLTTGSTTIGSTTSSDLKENDVPLTKKERSVDNKTLVKRNVPEDSNLIFWNDIYDDEYGVKMDPLDNAITDKHNTKRMNFVKKSGNWIQDRVRNFANNFRGKENLDVDSKKIKRRVLRKANDDTISTYAKYKKRAAKYEEADTADRPDSFAELTARMKSVCKEAAKTVQQTKNVQVRQDEKEDTMTTSLMQQLVRLMTDLVDFQVQQKTCVKLPPDLQDFLVWLTAPNSDQADFREQQPSYHEGNSFEKPPDQLMDLVTTPSSEREEVHADSRSECLGTLHAVQDLMQQYDEMTDEDKSKMTGIRDYLENQLQFLHRQLANFNDYKISNMFEDQNPSYRFRRDLPKKYQKSVRNYHILRNKRNRFKRRFLKNFGKKHTRTTASIYDGFAMTDVNKFTKDDNEKETNENLDEKQDKDVKRNLKDVYYKAVNDAKKSTTFKAVRKDDLEGFDHAQVVRIDN